MTPHLALLRFTIVQTLRERKLLLALLLLAGPCALAVLLRIVAVRSEGLHIWVRYHTVLLHMIVGGSAPMVCMLYGPALILGEAESGTLAYLFTRRMHRATVLVIRYLGVGLVLSAAIMAACVVGHLITTARLPANIVKTLPSNWRPVSDLGFYLALVPQAVAGYLAVFCLLNLVTKRSLIASGVYFVAVEVVLANMPIVARKYSIMHLLRKTAVAHLSGVRGLVNLPDPTFARQMYPAGETGVAMLSLIIVLLLVAAGIVAWRRELLPSRVTRE